MNDTPLINSINSIQDFRRIPDDRLNELAREIRCFLVDKVSKTGGHLASNLGVVELTIALERAFDSPNDKIIFDVGHQAYVNKILTGRAAGFDTLRQMDGLAGFPKREESCHDVFDTGHSSTSISAALGMLRAMRHNGEKGRAVAVIGDGALTGGMAFEALNDAGQSELPLIVILNDNGMSISRNVGAVTRHLNGIRASRGYLSAKQGVISLLDKIPKLGPRLHVRISRLKSRIKYFILPNVLFEELGFIYLGPIDGHDIKELTSVISRAKNINKPVLIHVHTKKGKGYSFAEKDPSRFHGIGRFCPETGEPDEPKNAPSNSQTAGDTLCAMAKERSDIAVVTAAMADGTGMHCFEKEHPDRFFDVGIAEQHAVTMAAGLAAGGMRPVIAVYSSFLQRAYDQMLHDVALQRLPVVFMIDRAGLVGADGETHQGVYDVAFMLTMPYIEIYSPATRKELANMVKLALEQNAPVAIRYGRDALPDCDYGEVEYGKWSELKSIAAVTVIATGRTVQLACEALDGVEKAGLVNARFIRPMDEAMLERIKNTVKTVIVVEDGIVSGGLGSLVCEYMTGAARVVRLGVLQTPVMQASIAQQTQLCRMDAASIRSAVNAALEDVK